MPAKTPSTSPFKMTLRSRVRTQDIQPKESKRRMTKDLKQEAVEEPLNNNAVKEQSEEKAVKTKLKPAAKRCVGRRKRAGEETNGDTQFAKIVDAVTVEKKESLQQCKNKSCEDSQSEVQDTALGNEEHDQQNTALDNEKHDQAQTVIKNKRKRKTATRHSHSQPRFASDAMFAEPQSDEKLETFSIEDWSTIEGIKARAERIFNVKLVACHEECSKAANITISGSTRETCLLCKEYLFALTRPGCKAVFPYPPEEHSFLTEDAVHEKLERDSQTSLIFRHVGEVEIFGLDTLSVALAMSSLENMLENHRLTSESDAPSALGNAGPEKDDSTKRQKLSRRSSLLLDAEFQNWMSSSSGDDAYRNANESVRHSILSVIRDECREVRVDAMKVHGIPFEVSSSALHSDGLKLLSEAYTSLLDDSIAPLSPSAVDGNPTASLGMESLKKNVFKDLDFACLSLQHKEDVVAGKKAMQGVFENSTIVTDTKKNEATGNFSAGSTRRDIQKLATGGEGIKTENANEYTISGDSESKRQSIIIVCSDSEIEIHVSSESDSEAQKDQHDHSKEVTSIKSSHIDREVSLPEKHGLSDKNRVPSGDKKPSQTPSFKSSKITEQHDLPSAELHETLKSLHHTSATSNNQTGSSTTTPIQANAVPSSVRCDSLKQVQITQNPTADDSNPVAPSVITPLLSIEVLPPTSSVTGTSKLRYVVIDGSNVAMAHGKNRAFSCRGIEICVEYFLQQGHPENQVTAFVPQSRLCRPGPYDKPIVDQHLLQKLADKGLVVFTPARKVPGKNIVCYDDRYILRLAARTNGIIVTNDNYRDLWQERDEWKEIIANRLLPFSFVGDFFMPPDDPLGRSGPTLTQFLRDQPPSWNRKPGSVRQWSQSRYGGDRFTKK